MNPNKAGTGTEVRLSSQGSGRDSRKPTQTQKESVGFLKTPAGKVALVVVTLVLVAIAAWQILAAIHGTTPGDPNTSMYVDSQTGQAFAHRNMAGESIPVHSPYSGSDTGYPGVACYWTASGEIKKDPTWVLLNSYIGKKGPTFCPDCGRMVNPLAPPPKQGDKPPPTRDELLHNDPAALR
jgi:hypothetical protein